MSSITVTNTSGEQREIEIVVGLSLMELLRDEGYDEILAICGGSCSCATCHVHIAPTAPNVLSPVEEDEEALIMMADAYDPQLSRLSCQIELAEEHDGLRVSIVEAD